MDQEARIEVSLTEGRFEVVGSENFVKEQTETLKNYVVENMKRIPLQQKHADPTEPSEIESLDTAEDGQSDLEYIFEEDEGAIRILADLPGNTNAEKTVNAALLYLYGKSIYIWMKNRQVRKTL